MALAGAFAIAFSWTYAQEETNTQQLDRQVDVTRDYRPTVEPATKLSVIPNMVDTVKLRPEFDYMINPTPITYGFGVKALSPVKVNAATYDPLYPFYLKVGGGFPGQSLADLYLNSTGRGRSSFGLYLNHTGSYYKRENDLGFKKKALQTLNSVGVNGEVGIGSISFGGEVGFDYDIYSRYGQFGYPEEPVQENYEVIQQKFMTPRATIWLGHDFSDLSHLNFGLTADGYYFKDDFLNSEIGVAMDLRFAKMFGEHRVSLSAGYRGAYGQDGLEGYKNHIINVAPEYEVLTDIAKIGIGCNFAFDITSEETEVVPLPMFNISFPGQPKIIPFVNLESRIEQNSYRALTELNPYLDENAALVKNTYIYDGRVGIEGSFSGVFAYRLYAGASLLRNAVAFANLYTESNSSTFIALREKQLLKYMAALELEGHAASNLSVMLRGRYFGYDTRTYDHPIGLPEYDVALKFKWNYRSKFFVTAGVDYIGNRWFMEYAAPEIVPDAQPLYVKVKPVADVNVEFEYRLRKTLGIFLAGHNLVGSELYYFNHYPDNNMRISTGVKLLF